MTRTDMLHWSHPDMRTCGHCGHRRDVHGAYRASNGGWRCNTAKNEGRGRCDCPGFQSVAALRDVSGESRATPSGEGQQ